MLRSKFTSTSFEIILRQMLQNTLNHKSTLIQIMTCHTSHYLSQCWPRSMSPNGISRAPWIKLSYAVSLSFYGSTGWFPLRWRHNGRDSVSNHQPHDCLFNRLFGRRWKKTSKLRITVLSAGNSPGTGEFPAQRPVTRKKFPFDDVIMSMS